MTDDERRPRLVLVHDRAAATEESVAFVELVRALVAAGGADVEVLLHGGGPLLDELRQIAPTQVVAELETRSSAALTERLCFALRLRRAGYRRRSRRLGLDEWGPGDAVYLHTILAVQTLRYLPAGAPVVACRLAEDVYPLRHPLRSADLALLLERVDRFLPVTSAGEDALLGEHHLDPARVHRVPELFVPRDDRLPDRAPERERLRATLGIEPGSSVIGSFGAYEADAPDLGVLLWSMLSRRLPEHRTVEMLWWYQETGAGFWMTHDLVATGLADHTHPISVDEEIGPYLELCDVLVLLTRESDHPFAYLERAAQGVPVLCFDVNDLADLVRLGDPRHVAPYLDLAALADELSRLIHDGDLAEDQRAMREAVAQVHGPEVYGRRLVEIVRAGDGR